MSANQRLRLDALTIFKAGIAAVEPGALVAGALDDGALTNDRFHVVSVGKAAMAMAQAAVALLDPDRLIGEPLVVTNGGNSRPQEGFRVMTCGHPLPDTRSVLAAAEVTHRASTLEQNQGLLVLLSGGSSSLLAAPVTGVSLADKAEITRLLLASGADIHEINSVRRHLSKIKGGGLARIVFPAPLVTLILSDVIDDDASVIGSGPTVPDPSTYQQAIEILKRHCAWDPAPGSIRQHLGSGVNGEIAETAKPGDPIFETTAVRLLGGNDACLQGAREAAAGLGYQTRIVDGNLHGEARQQAIAISGVAAKSACHPGPMALIWGGETTVTVRGSGLGGRNQELALAFALAMEAEAMEREWVLLSGGTDGRDGPTDAAGGLVDVTTITRLRQAGINPRKALDQNDSHRALATSEDLVITGPTGTNVADVQVLLLELSRPARG